MFARSPRGDRPASKMGSKLRIFEHPRPWRSTPVENRQQAAHVRALSSNIGGELPSGGDGPPSEM